MLKKIFILITLLLFSTTQASAFSVEHNFFVTVGRFNAALTDFTYALTPKNYYIKSAISTYGLFDSIYPFQAEYLTTGTISDDIMTITDYSYDSQTRYNHRTKKIYYDSLGVPQYQVSTKNDKEKKKEFNDPKIEADTFDLQTVFAKLTHQYNTLGFCDSQMTVFDGKRHFKVTAKDEGIDTLAPNEHSFYSGPANKCSLQISKVLSEDDDTLWEFSSNRPIYIWIVKDQETNHPFIARILIKKTPLGQLNAYASKISIKE